MQKMQARVIDSPVGILKLTTEDGFLTELSFGGGCTEPGDCAVLDAAEVQLAEYFSGKRRSFDLPLNLKGTPFQRAVWDALTRIPYGETASYGDIAREIGNPKACRAVGMANHRNPVSIIVPCHRVIGGDGSLTGYGGGLEIKRALLALERKWK